jgi:glycolate oxidase iron-sulfur subunit
MIAKELREEVYNCIKCGLCMSSCPVYKQLHYESVSPRGKVQLIKKILEGKLEPSENFRRILLTCLLCETCSVNCPSGLKVDRLMKAMRAELLNKFGLPWQKKAFFGVLKSNRLLSLSMFLGQAIGNPLRPLLSKETRLGTLALSSLPSLNRKPLRSQYPELVKAARPTGRVLYFTGCATNFLYENVGHAVIKVLNRLGMDVIIPKEQICCGLPIFMSGAMDMAYENIRLNLALFNRKDVEAVIVDCATCGAALKKEYIHIIGEMGGDTEGAQALADKVVDISQFVARFDIKEFLRPIEGRVTYHDPCHLLRTQGIKEEPRSMLKQIPGLQFVEMADAEICCGGGGSFQLEHPEISSGITAKKINSIMAACANIVATGCSGCRLQIKGNLNDKSISVVHPIELLAMSMQDQGDL